MCFLSFLCETNRHWNSGCSLKRVSVRIEDFQSQQHVWAICWTVNVSLLPSLWQHSLWITLLPPTVSHTENRDVSVYSMPMVHRLSWSASRSVQERSKEINKERRTEKKEAERKKWHHSDCHMSVSSVGLDAGVCFVSQAHTHTQDWI